MRSWHSCEAYDYAESNRPSSPRSPEDHSHPLALLGIIRNAELWRLFRARNKRHAFAANALLRWYRTGADVQAKLPLLATYMGHVSIASTEYYLQFIDQLASAASARFAARYGALVKPASLPDGGVR